MAGREPEPLLSPGVFRDRLFHGEHKRVTNNVLVPPALARWADRENQKKKGSVLTVGQRMWELFHSQLQYEDNSAWFFRRILGRGSYGIAALYDKYNSEGTIVKRLVIKTEQPRAELFISNKRPDISREAFLHAQVNKRENFANVFLHAYRYHTVNKLFTSPNTILIDPLHEWRYYLEFCSRDTIAELYTKYRAWGYHLPESFIWWIFYWLIRSCQSFGIDNERPFLDSSPKRYMENLPSSFLLHNDMTWWNVLLQHENQNRRRRVFWDRYPAPKFADYGLSQVKTKSGLDRTASQVKAGTPWFAPPEKRKMETRSNFYPFNPSLPDSTYPTGRPGEPKIKDQHHIDISSNLWGAAYLVYLLMTLHWPEDVHQHLEDNLEKNIYTETQKKWAKGKDARRVSRGLYLFDTLDTWLPCEAYKDYSTELIALVKDCTRIQPYLRPDLDEVEDRIKRGMLREHERLQDEFDGNEEEILKQTRVVLDNTEWNRIPHGPFAFDDLTPGTMPQGDTKEFWEYFGQRFNGLHKNSDDAFLIPPHPNSSFSLQRKYSNNRWLQRGADYVWRVWDRMRKDYHNKPADYMPYGGRALNPRKDHPPSDLSGRY